MKKIFKITLINNLIVTGAIFLFKIIQFLNIFIVNNNIEDYIKDRQIIINEIFEKNPRITIGNFILLLKPIIASNDKTSYFLSVKFKENEDYVNKYNYSIYIYNREFSVTDIHHTALQTNIFKFDNEKINNAEFPLEDDLLYPII